MSYKRRKGCEFEEGWGEHSTEWRQSYDKDEDDINNNNNMFLKKVAPSSVYSQTQNKV